MLRSVLTLLIAVVACQPTEPAPSARPTVIVSPDLPAPSPTAQTTPEPSSPFSGEGYEEWVIRAVLARYVDDLRKLYRDPDPELLQARFDPNAIDSAVAFDWRLRGSIEHGIDFVGDFAMRGFSTIREEPMSIPPLLESDVAIMVEPGSRLVDRASGIVIETWQERHLYAMNVTLVFSLESSRWIVTSVGPPSSDAFAPPIPTLAPPVRCEGLDPDQADTADVDESRPWCFGGVEGSVASSDQISVTDDYPCGETRAAIVTVGWPIGSAIDWSARNQFVSDPDGGFDRRWPLPIPYRSKTRLPDDAYSTGLTDGEFEIWVSPSAGATAIWAKRTTRVERWPRAPESWGVIDCN